jgi:hypothetical protein
MLWPPLHPFRGKVSGTIFLMPFFPYHRTEIKNLGGRELMIWCVVWLLVGASALVPCVGKSSNAQAKLSFFKIFKSLQSKSVMSNQCIFYPEIESFQRFLQPTWFWGSRWISQKWAWECDKILKVLLLLCKDTLINHDTTCTQHPFSTIIVTSSSSDESPSLSVMVEMWVSCECEIALPDCVCCDKSHP